jgi:hypothetical protein
MAVDERRGRIVLFGGLHGFTRAPTSETWEYDAVANSWAQRTPATVPPARSRHVMGWDASRARVVMAGGDGTTGSLRDVWEFDGSDWMQRQAETSIPAGFSGAAMTWDPTRAHLLLHGAALGGADPWELFARCDPAGRGRPGGVPLRNHSQPLVARPFLLGFANPIGVGALFLDVDAVQQPTFALGPPLGCAPLDFFVSGVTQIPVAGTALPNVVLPIPDIFGLRLRTLTFQAIALQSTMCLEATDALHARY